MVDKILSGAGFIKNTTYKETRFLKPPTTTYAIFNDTRDRRGADNINLLTEHEITIELYEYSPDPEAEKRLEDQFDALGVEYTRQDRYWIQEEQLYQLIYEFSYIEKGGIKA